MRAVEQGGATAAKRESKEDWRRWEEASRRAAAVNRENSRSDDLLGGCGAQVVSWVGDKERNRNFLPHDSNNANNLIHRTVFRDWSQDSVVTRQAHFTNSNFEIQTCPPLAILILMGLIGQFLLKTPLDLAS